VEITTIAIFITRVLITIISITIIPTTIDTITLKMTISRFMTRYHLLLII